MKSRVLFSAKAALVTAVVVTGTMAVPASTVAQQSVFRSIKIDLNGLPPGADFARHDMRACLKAELPRSFAGRVNPANRNAPVLVVRPISITLASSASGRRGSSSESDTLYGEAVVGSQRIPITVTGAASFYNDQALAVHNARLRMNALCQNFSQWLARSL